MSSLRTGTFSVSRFILSAQNRTLQKSHSHTWKEEREGGREEWEREEEGRKERERMEEGQRKRKEKEEKGVLSAIQVPAMSPLSRKAFPDRLG